MKLACGAQPSQENQGFGAEAALKLNNPGGRNPALSDHCVCRVTEDTACIPECPGHSVAAPLGALSPLALSPLTTHRTLSGRSAFSPPPRKHSAESGPSSAWCPESSTCTERYVAGQDIVFFNLAGHFFPTQFHVLSSPPLMPRGGHVPSPRLRLSLSSIPLHRAHDHAQRKGIGILSEHSFIPSVRIPAVYNVQGVRSIKYLLGARHAPGPT